MAFLHLSVLSLCVVLSCLCVLVTCPLSPSSLPGPYPTIAPDPGPQTIVRGSKGAKDGALTLLLDEFENMSVTRSNSLRRDSPPPPPTRARQENGMPSEQAATARGGPEKAGGQGWVAGLSEGGGSSGDRRRVGPEKKPKTSREGSGGPQESSRDKRPLSGPDVSTPQPAGVASGAKVAAGRPFNTYPRADTDHLSRGTQVTDPPAPGSPGPLSQSFPCPHPPTSIASLLLGGKQQLWGTPCNTPPFASLLTSTLHHPHCFLPGVSLAVCLQVGHHGLA